jgi:glucose/mannose-6-phosphate isomerase
MRETCDPAVLDDQGRRSEIDKSDMLGLVADFPEQCERALEIAASSRIPDDIEPANVVIAGMGGSGIGGDIVARAFEDLLKTPVRTCRSYSVPAYVSTDSLVICTSYSGNTEETLSAFADADSKGARIVCISSGGKLSELARSKSHTLITVPGGQPPRSATGYLLIPQIVVFDRLGLIPGQKDHLQATIDLLKKQRSGLTPDLSIESNRAKQIAVDLFGRVPVIYGSSGWGGVAAYRWKTQINENAKVHAFANRQSELSHNEILGWEGCGGQGLLAAVVNIRDRDESAKLTKRTEVANRLVGSGATIVDVWAEAGTPLQKTLTSAYLGDFASVYLGLLYGTDLTPIAGIDILKAELERQE